MIEPEAGQTCYAGLDLSSTQDITALSVVFPQQDGTASLQLHCWIPSDGLRERSMRDRVPYDRWAETGLIELSPGTTIDYALVEDKLRELRSQYDLREVAYDPWNARDLAQRLIGEGFQMVEFRQTLKNFTVPTKQFEKAVLERRLRHGDNPLLRWMVDCCSVYSDSNGNIRPVKPDRHKDSRRIDGIVSSIMGLDRLNANSTGPDLGAILARGPITFQL